MNKLTENVTMLFAVTRGTTDAIAKTYDKIRLKHNPEAFVYLRHNSHICFCHLRTNYSRTKSRRH
jgi:hypothetical protein